MNLAIFIVIAAVLALGVILRLAVTQRLQARPNASPAAIVHPIDLEAFRNLIDPAEDEYLRRALPPARFRKVRRQRLYATAAYVQDAAANANVMARIGEAALANGNPQTLEAAQELVNQALLVRRNTALALVRIYVAMAWPSYGLTAVRVADHYDRLSSSAMLLGRLQNPAIAVRISAVR